MFDMMEQHSEEAVIKVIGVGGGGGNAVEHMVKQQIEGVRFIAANTDAQALRNSSADVTVQLGTQITSGLGAGANPEVGRNSAEEDAETIRASLEGADMVFIAAGMGVDKEQDWQVYSYHHLTISVDKQLREQSIGSAGFRSRGGPGGK